ncbi:hypothetical protein [Azospirillum picis]|uniref:Cation/H+ exchanger domain-containing protein n=1 Tax=Azospirillum picis TaxID=488438 RepID=A0ABU0MSE0_9PROT|nr:hypothetical protein [Azospirillum picis]MBP2300872.1 hypothetical protein [Azospirillum picis]MDQ0536129.1 hypothetical protein [Azospirillum picis]
MLIILIGAKNQEKRFLAVGCLGIAFMEEIPTIFCLDLMVMTFLLAGPAMTLLPVAMVPIR